MKIEDIKSPEFLKSLSIKELENLSDEIREFIIEQVSKTGGHLSSNLGVVEMTVALHYVFNSPYDKFIFDVGHQGYTHKILTGRAKDFAKLRKKDGLGAFLKYSESEHDVWEAGHSSTALSAAAGFLEAKASGVDMGEVITIVGDGSIQNGLSFEGLNYLGSQSHQKAIIIFNDNDMSISRNVGSLAKKFNKIRIRKSYFFFKKVTPNFLHRLFRSVKVAFRSFVYGDNIFSTLGFKYYGPIDGHNIAELVKYFTFAKNCKQSIILHVKTNKGKGYPYSEYDDTGYWHGVKPFNIETGKPISQPRNGIISWGQGICNILVECAKKNDNFQVITPAMIEGSRLKDFQKAFPTRLIDVGIAEEHAVVMAAAMARNNVIPIVSIYSTFMQRAYDQINHDVCRSNNHVIFLVDRAGLNGGDGSTHQGIFDISFLSHLPNIIITMPKDLHEAYNLFKFALKYQGPVVIRYAKSKTKNISYFDEEIELGTWVEEKPINKVNIITYGDIVNEFIEKLPDNIGLINARFIKPLDINMLQKLKNTRVMVVEEVIKNGSLGSMILKANNDYHLNLQIETYGVEDQYLDAGTTAELRKELQIDVESIMNKL